MYSAANKFFSTYFGLGILFAIILAFMFPYIAITLNPSSFFLLFFLMVLSGFTIDWSKLGLVMKNLKEVIFANIALYVIIPFFMFLLAKTFLADKHYMYGVVFSALTPAAIVAPFFTKVFKADRELSFVILVSSMLISPFVIPLVLSLFLGNYLAISGMILFKDILLLVPLPLFIAFLVRKYSKPSSEFLTQSLPILNFFLLALLIFIQFGSSINRLNINYLEAKDVFLLIGLGFIQDFGLLLFLQPLSNWVRDEKKSVAIFASISMKNIAIASSILLLYSPKAALAPTLGFVAHAFLFTPFILQRLIRASLKS